MQLLIYQKSQAKAYRLADNRTNEDSSWDEELLKGELLDLEGLDLTGFEDYELEKLLEEPEPEDEPDVENFLKKLVKQ